ncbi:MAG: DUF4440 domain-containing protein [Vicinamibacterales bacterium]|jgi:ketosteroid isomerase-like protein|nr:hypothetical protein [Acidobacteriota bacterium]MDP6371966.1 DUF4440 domain-containing protein [Vicinamibacterales bacterium]MDP6610545.1 DUF4440 domain-containing protein [Vicinamibacterales bacterium]HAK55824.1 hypothetical protein [Acidobacteriota bacterium]|tara:strand:- start:3594 stop:4418 length:825 start_codon:yes stop_codon:yes gene_type:complete
MARSLVTIVALVGLGTGLAAQDPNQVGRRYRSLVDTERRFAAASVELGSRAAFRTYLTRDAVIFRPGPVNGWDTVARQSDDGITLEWAPTRAELSQAGDLGLTVGVWRRTDAEGGRTFGRYVTLWQRTIEGSWRVVADIGTAAPNDLDWPVSVEAGSLTPRTGGIDLSEQAVDARLDALRNADQTAEAIDRMHPAVEAWRNGQAPRIGAEAVVDLAAREAVVREQVDVVIARSGDLGYGYGSAEVAGGAAGGYLRVWSRGPDGWAVLLDVVTAG